MKQPLSSLAEIKEIKQKINDIKTGIAKREALQKKREELENFLLETQVKAQHAILKAHQNEIYHSDEANSFYNKAKEYETLNKNLLQKLALVDKEIDLWENVEESELSHLQGYLIQKILKVHPEQQNILESLEKNRQKWELILTHNDRLLTLLHNLEHLITTIQLTRKRIKSQGILSYIFGASPNLMISQCFQGILRVLQEEKNALLPNNSLTEYDQDRKNAIEKLYLYTTELNKDCQKRWNYRHLDNLIEKNFIKIQEFQAQFELFQTLINEKQTEAEKEFQDWLSQY